MLPVQLQTSLAYQRHKIQDGVRLTNTHMRTGAKDKPVLVLIFGIACDPPVRIVGIGIRIGFWIVEGRVRGGYYHRSYLEVRV